MKQFIYDMIHMTQGEKLIHYWWLWFLLIAIEIILEIIKHKLDKDITKLSKEINGGKENETKPR